MDLVTTAILVNTNVELDLLIAGSVITKPVNGIKYVSEHGAWGNT